MSQLISRYQNNAIASKKKHIFTRLLDYFTMFVLSYLIFTLVLPLSARMPFADNIAKNINNATRAAFDYIDSTRLQTYNEDKTELNEINVGAAKYVKNLAKTSCFVHDILFPVKQEDSTFIDVPVTRDETFIADQINFELDDNAFYYRVFKANEPSLNKYNDNKTYDELSFAEVEQFIYVDKMKLNASDFVTIEDEDYLARGEGTSRYTILTEEKTLEILNYFREDTKDKKLYNSLYRSYAYGIQAGIKDVEKNCVPYKALANKLDYWIKQTSLVYIVAYSLSYVIAYLIMLFIPRLIFKEWVTLGQRVLSIGITDKNELEPSAIRLIGYHLINFLLFYSTLFIALLLMGQISMLSLPLIGPITFLMVLLFILIFNIFSLFMPLFTKQNHDFSTYVSGILLKDKNEFDVPIEDSGSKEIEDGSAAD